MLSAIILLQNLRWLLPTAFMIGASPAYITAWGIWRVISAVLPHRIYIKGDEFLYSTYNRNLIFFFETLTGAELIFYGDLNAIKEQPDGENCLYMSNHQSTMDWVIASCVALRRGCLGRVRFVLKDGLKFLPLYGVYLGLHDSLFVKRAGRFSRKAAEKHLKKSAQKNLPMWFVVFPEGTRYNPELMDTIVNSKKFAEDQGVQALQSVLYPRAGAVQVCVHELKNNIDAVYDVTIAYGNTYDYAKKERLPGPSMQDFLMGMCHKVHIHIARIPINEVPSDPEDLKKWLYSRYQAKDRLLQEFYSAESENEARFPGLRIVKPLPLSVVLPSLVMWSGTFVLLNYSEVDRNVYWKVGFGAAVFGIIWAGIRY